MKLFSRTLKMNQSLSKRQLNVKKVLSPLQVLINLGISTSRAKKALAVTGNKNAEVALQWLLSRIQDPDLDSDEPFEYVLYLCPTGNFLNGLQSFQQEAFHIFGWNDAFNFLPHISLTSFFKLSHENAATLSNSLNNVIAQFYEEFQKIILHLKPHLSNNFIGYVLDNKSVEYLKFISLKFVENIRKLPINESSDQLNTVTVCFPWCTNINEQCIQHNDKSMVLEPFENTFYLMLAYQFDPIYFEELSKIFKKINYNCPISWDLRLYSRDPKLNEKHLFKVIYQNDLNPVNFEIGEFVYSDIEKNESDKQIKCVSWNTGLNGLIDFYCLERIQQNNLWFLLKSVNIVHIDTLTDNSNNINQICHNLKDNMTVENSQNRMVYVVRHGERTDLTFYDWLTFCFDKNGQYIRKDLNLPKFLPIRKNYRSAYVNDCPLTNIGLKQAKLLGEAMSDQGLKFDHVFSSPPLRCVQTCDAILKGLNYHTKIPIKIEPGFFEFLFIEPDKYEWITSEEFKDLFEVNIDENYEPIRSVDDLKMQQKTCDQFYKCFQNVLHDVLNKYSTGNILIVGHSITIDACFRALMYDGKGRSRNDMNRTMKRIPYCASIAFKSDPVNSGWQFCDSGLIPITNSNNFRFNLKILQS